jgi:secreted PhoX family phosphatase
MTAGDIYTIAGNGGQGFSGDGGPATGAELFYPQGVAVDAAGNVLIADSDNNRVRLVAESTGTLYGRPVTAGDIYTIAGNGGSEFSGDGGPATKAQLGGPPDVAVDHAGNLLIADAGNDRVRAVAAGTGTFYGVPMTAGDIYTIAGSGIERPCAIGGSATAADLFNPEGIAVDHAGNLLIADTFDNCVQVVAASAGTFYGHPMNPGDIVALAGTGNPGFSGDGGPATKAKLNGPVGLAVDNHGNLLTTDEVNQRIRVVAESTGRFYGRAMTAGDIYTIAGTGTAGFSGDGGPATKAKLNGPARLVVDGHGNVLFGDPGNNRVRMVAESTGRFYGRPVTAGNIYTIAGTGTGGFSGDGGPATKAELGGPPDVAVDAAGNLLIADAGNSRIRAVAPS